MALCSPNCAIAKHPVGTAWGEVRYQAGTTSTGYTYTGQYSNTADFGLMYYNARWYDPTLGRFAQADSIVPGGVQEYDRYAYVQNNPLRYTDPNGHIPACDRDDWACQYHWDMPITQDDKYTIQLTEKESRIVDFLLDSSEIVASVTIDPVDWALTIDSCTHDDCSPWILAAGLLPFIPSSAGKYLDDMPWKSIVDSKYWEVVEGAFKGEPKVVALTEDLKVFRHYSGDIATSPWFSTRIYTRPGNARRYLALPNKNLATNVAEFIIPKDTKILVGSALSKVTDTFFGSHAVGGGIQIYLPNPAAAVRIK